MPTPSGNESESQFISRCMGDAEARRDFPEDDQRLAFCYSQWEGKKIERKEDGNEQV